MGWYRLIIKMNVFFLSFIVVLGFLFEFSRELKVFGSKVVNEVNYNSFNLKTLENLKIKHGKGIIELNTDLFKKFSNIDNKDRNYHLFILFNALDAETKCQVCSFAVEVYNKMKNIFGKKAKKGSLPSFFTSIELRPNMEAFQMVGLDRVPVLMHFGPKSRAPSLFENLNPNDIGALLKFITVQSESTLNIEDAIKPDPNYNSIIVFACAAAFIAGLIFTGLIKASTIFQNTYIWSILINGFIVVMLSGYMWTKIRNPPYMATNQPNNYFINSPQSQLGVESKIISILNAGIVLVFILITPITYKFEGTNKRRVAAMVMSLLYMAGHAALLRIFTVKFHGYPLTYIF